MNSTRNYNINKKLIFTNFVKLVDHIKCPKYNADYYEYRKI